MNNFFFAILVHTEECQTEPILSSKFSYFPHPLSSSDKKIPKMASQYQSWNVHKGGVPGPDAPKIQALPELG